MRTEKEIRAEIKSLFQKLNRDNLRPFEASEYNYKMQALCWVLGEDEGHYVTDIIICPKCGNEAELMDALLDEHGELFKTPYAHCLTCKHEW